MATPGKVDYHVHYHLDACANDEMILANIEREAARLGLEEICVVKHYSRRLPNGLDSWVFWKKIVPEQFTEFLDDVRRHRPSPEVRMLAGVETELLDDSGELNITAEHALELDALIVSVHWLPQMAALAADPELIPGQLDKSPPAVVARWHDDVRKVGVAGLVDNFISAYVKAIEKSVRPLVLGHMGDGLLPLRNYGVPVDDLSDTELCARMEPLMAACGKKPVVWELTHAAVWRPSVLMRANELGVRFTATADAHFLGPDGWACLSDHDQAESYVSSLGLTKGVLPQRQERAK